MRFGIALSFANYTDWDRFEALERGEPSESLRPTAMTDARVWREHLALADLAEPLGFDTLWTFEQHGAPYLMITDPHQFFSYFAGRTRRIDFGSMITVLPWHNPFRLAEQIAMLQHHMGPGRRYFLGVGRGLARRDFEAMSVDMETSRERFNEVLDILQLAFTEEMFSYEGRFFAYRNASLRPRPLDPTVVTGAWGAWTSEASLRNMAVRGLHPLTAPTKELEGYLQELDLFNELRIQAGHGPANRPVFQVPLYCCESEQEALEGAEQFFYEYADSVRRQYEIGTNRFANTTGFEEYSAQKSAAYGGGTAEGAVPALKNKFLRVGLVGTPEQCAEKVVAHYEQINPSELVTVAGVLGTMSSAQAEKSIRLYAEKVLPRVAHLRRETAPLAVS
jgi:alkanesulfonate monooxygenase SsuD/methylene tetrahydromethanopterin reductase-like flavin-dependent oxidoreductase (luciferase family)